MSKDISSQQYIELKAELRSILISSSQGCNEQQLLRDYAEYNGGREIPFRQMGYGTLIDLLKSMPDVATIDAKRYPVIVHGVADEHTEHIKKMVMQQKKNKKTSRTARNPVNRNYGNNSYNRPNGPSVYSRNRQQPGNYNTGIPHQPYSQIHDINGTQWDTPVIPNIPKLPFYQPQFYLPQYVVNPVVPVFNYQPRIGANQSTTTKTVASFPEKSTPIPSVLPSLMAEQPMPADFMSIPVTSTMDDNSSVVDDDSNYSEDDELAGFDTQQAIEHGDDIVFLRKRIRQLLLKFPNGLWLSNVEKLYSKTFKEDLNLKDYKLKSLMAFFDCVSDFVDSRRDRSDKSTDRILLLKPNYVEAVKREIQTPAKIRSNIPLSSVKDDQNSPRQTPNTIDRPIVDLTAFVSLDFRYRRTDYTSNELFEGFFGDIDDPWTIHIGNAQFIPQRDRMMEQLQEHYSQSSNQSIYNIPFEQLELDLSCVYRHNDDQYYRAYIMGIESTDHSDIIELKIYLVDYGLIIPDIYYYSSSTALKFLHKNFSSLSTQVYDCRLANIHYPAPDSQWSDGVRQFLKKSCHDKNFLVEITGRMDAVYCINLWLDSNQQESMNQLLIQEGYAVEHQDSLYPEFESFHSSRIPLSTNNNNSYIDERFSSIHEQNYMGYDHDENNIKYFEISIEHAYYFVKHPFTKRPCLPCFEVARLLNKDETYVSQLNLIREANLPFSESNRTLFHDLRCLSESHKCPHINQNDEMATIKLYDLSSIRDYLLQIKFQEGDVIDILRQEYDDYERPGYWNEKKNSYINKENFESQEENLHDRRGLLNFRREQLVSLSKSHQTISAQNEMQEIDQELNNLDDKIHIMKPVFSSIVNDSNSTLRPSSSTSTSTSNVKSAKMRETLFRIARPFDQQFSLNIRFNHQNITDDMTNDDDIEERFQDLFRILKNVTQFFTLESEIPDETSRNRLDEASHFSTSLIDQRIELNKRIELYNYYLELIQYFQPTIRSYVQRTDLLDTIY